MIDTTPLPICRPFDDARLSIARLAIVGPLTLQETLRQIGVIAAQTLKVDRVSIWMYSPHRSQIRCVMLYERNRNQFSEGMTLHVADSPEYFSALETRRAVATESAVSDPQTARLKEAYLDPLGITSMLDAPVFVAGAVVGIVCHEQTGAIRHWTTEERDFAASIADAVALRLKSAELADAWRMLNVVRGEAVEARTNAALVNLAAGVAHDFRNLLTIILGNGDLIAANPAVPTNAAEQARQIVAAAERGIALASELTDLARSRTAKPRVVAVGAVVQEALPVLRSSVGPEYPLEFECTAGETRVLIDPHQLERIVMNLTINARDAMPRGGPIRISIRSVAEGVRLEISDRGTGIDPAVVSRIFDPFFTTKPRSRGTGLGLAIVRTFVEQARGSVSVESALGVGTTIRIDLPKATSAPDR